ncbi:hypothetical protein [Herbaspirillum rubrisubalbicans]|uniref:Cobalt transporter n=1 Tax=Herbaspirillum rubrisubalbicans Os34 TaxID=1235827 RepID=A0A6M3ZLB1_9BURK|nr:hypothetical protein [Herbaspirillum rubrisubalbicans]QJP99300.1 hypothetical protein C798_03385 [Herbaspirillum rubrisubalbicans Os34]
MKRVWVLLLICLLPVQVFAAVLTYASSMAATDFSAPAPVHATVAVQHLAAKPAFLSDHHVHVMSGDQSHAVASDAGSSDDDSAGYADNGEDFSSHAGIGDEPVLIHSLAFAPQTSRLAPALRSDAALQPPFLPRAGRPPRA